MSVSGNIFDSVGRRFRFAAWFGFAFLLAGGAAASSASADVTSEQVKTAVRKAVGNLKQLQRRDGSWLGRGRTDGSTALCTLALLQAGVDANDPAILKAIKFLQNDVNDHVYTASLKCQVFAFADPVKYKRHLQASAKYLVKVQLGNGMWGYSRQGSGGDNSNTQFAMLGLYEAAKAGVKIPRTVWLRSVNHYRKAQNANGSWGYRRRTGTGYGSMTAAAIASLYIGGQSLNVNVESKFVNGANPSCGKYSQNVMLAKGLDWMTKNFSAKRNPGQNSWFYYYLYALERVGMISGMRAFGRHDWYRLGAEQLVQKQKDDGSWGNSVHTSFALLFLAKGNRPVIIQKIQWKGRWNRNHHDLENLTNAIGDKLGKQTTWQTVPLSLPLKDLRQSPILLISGHEFPNFTAEEIEKLKEFVDQAGGTLLFEACCGSQKFARGFRLFCKKVWPDYHLGRLRKDHPIFYCHHKLPTTYDMEGLSQGCRTAVFFSPRALTCLWELKTIPKHSEFAFQLGTNICAYATGKDQLRDKLEVVELPETHKNRGPREAEIPRGAVQIARIIHDGDYNTDPHAMVNLAQHLRKNAKIDVVARSRHLKTTDKSIYEFPVVFMTGHHKFTLSPEEIKAFRLYLKKGGFLMASNCCGRPHFDTAFREMVKKLFPDAKFEKLPADHPIYTGKTGVALGEVKYRPALAKKLAARGSNRPVLEAVKIDGRTAIIYSKWDFCCGLENDRPFSCLGYSDDDAKRLAMSIFLYAMNY